MKTRVLLALGSLAMIGCGPSAPNAPPESAFLGGKTTVFDNTRGSFGHPAANLSGEERDRFFIGNAIFNRGWVTAVASVADFDGLGPLFNATSCSGCHFKDGRGRPPIEDDERFLSMLVRISVPGDTEDGSPAGEPTYGGQIQGQGILGVAPEGIERVTWTEEKGTFGDGKAYSLRRPSIAIDDLGYGPFAEGTMFSARVAPHTVGLGLLEAVDEEDLVALEDPEDADGDGVSGRANFPWDVAAGTPRIGRFGWKSNQPSLRQQSAGAFNGDMGITSALFPEEGCTGAESECQSASTGPTPQLAPALLDDVVFYMSTLAVPAQRDYDDPEVVRGGLLFEQMGCASCHVPSLTTGHHDIAALSGQTIFPYSDLLLHDMGEDLADGRPDFDASGAEWRTPPLWGLGLVPAVNDHDLLLHDGRARGFAEAILWHGGEAESSRESFRNAQEEDRDALVTFLESL